MQSIGATRLFCTYLFDDDIDIYSPLYPFLESKKLTSLSVFYLSEISAMRLGAYGLLPRDLWSLVGNRCNLSSKFKIAATCTKLQTYFNASYDLNKWTTTINDSYLNPCSGVQKAAKYNYGDLVGYILYKYPMASCNYLMNNGLYGAAQGGHLGLVYFFISKGAENWNHALACAAKGGHRNLVDFFLLKGSGHSYFFTFDAPLEYAAKAGHKDLVDLFISKGATDWDRGLSAASLGGHRDLIDLFISKGANNWNWALMNAAEGGHHDLIDFFIAKGADIDASYLSFVLKMHEAKRIKK